MEKYYNLESVETLLSKCTESGYEFVELKEGVLGYGHLILLSPDDAHWNFEIQEHYLNCWSSDHVIRRFRKINKTLQKEIDKAYERLEEECE